MSIQYIPTYMADTEEFNMTMSHRALEDLEALIPEAVSRQEAIRICVSEQLHRRRTDTK